MTLQGRSEVCEGRVRAEIVVAGSRGLRTERIKVRLDFVVKILLEPTTEVNIIVVDLAAWQRCILLSV